MIDGMRKSDSFRLGCTLVGEPGRFGTYGHGLGQILLCKRRTHELLLNSRVDFRGSMCISIWAVMFIFLLQNRVMLSREESSQAIDKYVLELYLSRNSCQCWIYPVNFFQSAQERLHNFLSGCLLCSVFFKPFYLRKGGGCNMTSSLTLFSLPMIKADILWVYSYFMPTSCKPTRSMREKLENNVSLRAQLRRK